MVRLKRRSAGVQVDAVECSSSTDQPEQAQIQEEQTEEELVLQVYDSKQFEVGNYVFDFIVCFPIFTF